jgi:hypothetical protein
MYLIKQDNFLFDKFKDKKPLKNYLEITNEEYQEELRKQNIVRTNPKNDMPSAAQQAINLAGSLGRAASTMVKGGNVKSKIDTIVERLSICKSCEFMNEQERCSKCGCQLFAKVTLATEKCPEGKWLEQKD